MTRPGVQCPAGASCYALDVEPEPAGETVRTNGEEVQLRAGALTLRLGCFIVGHKVLGWCSSCPGITAATEAAGWRLLAAGYPAPDSVWALAVSGHGG